MGEDVIKMARGDNRVLEEEPFLSDLYRNLGNYALVWGGLSTPCAKSFSIPDLGRTGRA